MGEQRQVHLRLSRLRAGCWRTWSSVAVEDSLDVCNEVDIILFVFLSWFDLESSLLVGQ